MSPLGRLLSIKRICHWTKVNIPVRSRFCRTGDTSVHAQSLHEFSRLDDVSSGSHKRCTVLPRPGTAPLPCHVLARTLNIAQADGDDGARSLTLPTAEGERVQEKEDWCHTQTQLSAARGISRRRLRRRYLRRRRPHDTIPDSFGHGSLALSQPDVAPPNGERNKHNVQDRTCTAAYVI